MWIKTTKGLPNLFKVFEVWLKHVTYEHFSPATNLLGEVPSFVAHNFSSLLCAPADADLRDELGCGVPLLEDEHCLA